MPIAINNLTLKNKIFLILCELSAKYRNFTLCFQGYPTECTSTILLEPNSSFLLGPKFGFRICCRTNEVILNMWDEESEDWNALEGEFFYLQGVFKDIVGAVAAIENEARLNHKEEGLKFIEVGF